MSADLLITLTAATVAVIALFLRTNIAIATLALGGGYVVADLAGPSIVSTLFKIGVNTADYPVGSIVSIVLTLLPSVLLLWRFTGFQAGRFFEHIVPAVTFGLIVVTLVLVQLPFSVQNDLDDTSYVFRQFDYFRTFIVLSAVFIAVFDVMVHERKLRRKAKRGRKKN
jgi:hypothetical protein